MFNEKIKFDQFEQVAKIKVIGVGGAGNNAVNRMVEENVQGVEFWIANTDSQVLTCSKVKNKIILGKQLTKGLGAGADPVLGHEAALESEQDIKEALKGADMIFVAAGMGGGTGTGAAPIVAKIAKDLGSLTIGIVTKPFGFEGNLRCTNAEAGLNELKQHVDSLIIVSNDKVLEIIGGVPLHESFKEADKVLRQGVQTITDLIAVPALINLDFADVKTVMTNKGNAMIGIGMGQGENKSEESAHKAIASPLLEASITGAKNAVVNITVGKSGTLYDANDAVDIIKDNAGDGINIIFGVAVNENLDDEMIVTVIATGFDEEAVIKADQEVINHNRQNRHSSSAITAEQKQKVQNTAENTGYHTFDSFNETGPESIEDTLHNASQVEDLDSEIPAFIRRR